MDKWVLAIDTSSSQMAVAVLKDGYVVSSFESNVDRNHSVHLLPAIEQVLREASITPGDLHAIAAGVGPGSYTGVRIAVTVAKTMAWAQGIPVYGFSSMEALAWSWSGPSYDAQPDQTWIVPLLDARRGQVFSSIFRGDGVRVAEDGIRVLRDWLPQLLMEADTANIHKVRFVGETEGFHAVFEAAGERSVDHSVQPVRLHHTGLAYAALRAIEHTPEDVHRLVPNYTQLAEAEAKLLAAKAAAGEACP